MWHSMGVCSKICWSLANYCKASQLVPIVFNMCSIICNRIKKNLLLLTNVLIFTIGCRIIYYGASWRIHDDMSVVHNYLVVLLFNPGVIFLIAGSVMTFFSFIGCCCILCPKIDENVVKMYCLLMTLVLLCEAGYSFDIAILHRLPDFMEWNLQFGITNYSAAEPKTTLSTAWDLLQTQALCCGMHGPQNWKTNKALVSMNKVVPDSCCKNHEINCGVGELNHTVSSNIYTAGCIDRLFTSRINRHFYVLAGTIILYMLAQFMLVTLTCVYIHRMRYKRYFALSNMDVDSYSDEWI